MAKILVRRMMFMIVVATLITLSIISGCVTSNGSFPNSRKMTAVRQIFPPAVDITEMQINQGAQVSGRPDDAKISEIKDDSGLLGYCVESKVVSRSGPFRIRVLLDQQLIVKKATVISYPGERGRDVRKRIFTDQFQGKGPDDPIQIGEDIDAISGATISSRIMTEGVHDTIILLKLVKETQHKNQTESSSSPNN